MDAFHFIRIFLYTYFEARPFRSHALAALLKGVSIPVRNRLHFRRCNHVWGTGGIDGKRISTLGPIGFAMIISSEKDSREKEIGEQRENETI